MTITNLYTSIINLKNKSFRRLPISIITLFTYIIFVHK